MPGFNQAQLTANARNANTVTVMIGTQPLAFAQNVTHTFDAGAEALFGVGNAKPQEIQQLKVQPSITIDQFNLTAAGMQLLQSSQTPLSSYLLNNEFNITIVDGTNGQILFTYVGCVAGTFNESIATNQPITDAITFMALDVLDVTGQSILNGPNAFVI